MVDHIAGYLVHDGVDLHRTPIFQEKECNRPSARCTKINGLLIFLKNETLRYISRTVDA